MIPRRRLLGGIAGLAAGLAGCASAPRAGTPTPTSTPIPGSRLAHNGIPGDICEAEVIEGFGIRAIVEPAFGPDWDGIEVPDRYGSLDDGATVVGLVEGGRARAYPVHVLWEHEVVNDEFGGPLLVTYCPLCLSGLVADRLVRGEPTRFGVSGQLWKPPELYRQASFSSGRAFAAGRRNASTSPVDGGNLVMYDEATRSFWSQLLGRAICGPMTGARLDIRPNTVTTWGEWRGEHPGTDVLLPPPHSTEMG